jgi:uncharacterized protein (TIGR02246 family)
MTRTALAAILVLLASPAFAQQKSQVQAANAKFEQAFNSGNAAAVAALYTTQAEVMPPGAPVAMGRDAIQKFWQSAIQAGVKNLHLTTVSVDRFGPAMREIGSFTMDAPGQGGQVAHLAGKYVVIWKREGKSWLLDTDIWNANG